MFSQALSPKTVHATLSILRVKAIPSFNVFFHLQTNVGLFCLQRQGEYQIFNKGWERCCKMLCAACGSRSFVLKEVKVSLNSPMSDRMIPQGYA